MIPRGVVLGSPAMFHPPRPDPDPRPLAEILAELSVSEGKRPVLELGAVVITEGAMNALEEAGEFGLTYLRRHQGGDWGDLCAEDCAVNQRALRLGHNILSQYTLPTGEKLWLLTEADRSCTTLLLASEY